MASQKQQTNHRVASHRDKGAGQQSRGRLDAGADRDMGNVVMLEAAIERKVQQQRVLIAEGEPEFSPLECTLPPATPFPSDALGERLLRYAQALQKISGAPLPLNAVALLALANFAVSPLADIKFMGRPLPTSLFFVVIGASGERKSTILGRLMAPVYKYQSRLEAEADRRVQNDLDAAEASGTRRIAVASRPCTDVYCTEGTTSALDEALMHCAGRLLVSTAEAGIFINCHAMQSENKLSFFATLSNLCDAEPVKLLRRTGEIKVSGKRLTLLLMGQLGPVQEFLTDSMAQEQGLISRLLVSFPDSLIGSRELHWSLAKEEAVMEEYDAWITDILDRPLPVVEGTVNVLDPPLLTLTPEAREEYEKIYYKVEREMGKRGALRSLPRDDQNNLINKMATASLKLAATLQLSDNPAARDLDAEHVRRGVALVEYFMAELKRVTRILPTAKTTSDAIKLMELLRSNRLTEFTSSWCYSKGPHSLRTQKTLKPVLHLLEEYGWIMSAELPKGKGVARSRRVYRLTSSARQELGL